MYLFLVFTNGKCSHILSDAFNYQDLYYDILSRYYEYDLIFGKCFVLLNNMEQDRDMKDVYKVLSINRSERIKYFSNHQNCFSLFDTLLAARRLIKF